MDELNARYQRQIDQQSLNDDPAQRIILDKLQAIYNALLRPRSWLVRLGLIKRPVKGLYFYGGVGIGKTFLMDLFFDALPFRQKLRMHFHQFMREVQLQLTELQGQANPLELVAAHFAKRTKILCFDEFFVVDIADAMILERLFNALFQRGVSLVTTSNIAPDDLYFDGLHRARFLPAIELIKQHCDVYHLASNNDYRLAVHREAGVYFSPLNQQAEQNLSRWFELYAHHSGEKGRSIMIENRYIPTRYLCKAIVWFDFNDLCHTPRSQLDYLAIAERFQVVIVSNIPVIKANDVNSITYLIYLVDVFYDAGIKLIISAQVHPEKLYPRGPKRFAFERTVSRLTEMQSSAYFER